MPIPSSANTIGMMTTFAKLNVSTPSETVELIKKAIMTADVIVAAVDFFRMPKNNGIKAIAPIMNAFVTVFGNIAHISCGVTVPSNNSSEGCKKYVMICMSKMPTSKLPVVNK